jgi:hypothetical protein
MSGKSEHCRRKAILSKHFGAGKTGRRSTETFEDEFSLDQFHGWYDLVVTVAGDATFKYRLAGHVETGKDSFSDPALGGLVSLKA